MGQGRTLTNQFDPLAYFEATGLVADKRKRAHEPKLFMPSRINYPLRAGFAVVDHAKKQRDPLAYSGTKKRRYMSPRRAQAPRFNAVSDGNRAIKRAERWLRNRASGPDAKPPWHIIANAHDADLQFRPRG